MKKILFLAFLMSFAFAKAQSLNNFKYVVVDNQYDFQSQSNEYRLNELIIFELEKQGFTAFRNNQVIPEDMNRGICNTLYVAIKKSGFLNTTLDYSLNDCQGNTIVELPRGSSQIKDYQKAYFDATRQAFQYFEGLDYQYVGTYKKDAYLEPQALKTQKDAVVTSIPAQELVIEKAINPNLKKEPEITPAANVIAMDFQEKSDNAFALKFSESGDTFQLYRHGIAVGSGRKSAAGVFLVSSDFFTGIGFKQDNSFIIEYDENGTLRRIELFEMN